MVARQHYQMAARLLKIDHKAVVQLARVAWRRTGIEDVARDDNRVYALRLGGGQQPAQKGIVFGRAALAVEVLAEVPVRGMDNAHSDSVRSDVKLIINIHLRWGR